MDSFPFSFQFCTRRLAAAGVHWPLPDFREGHLRRVCRDPRLAGLRRDLSGVEQTYPKTSSRVEQPPKIQNEIIGKNHLVSRPRSESCSEPPLLHWHDRSRRREVDGTRRHDYLVHQHTALGWPMRNR